MKEYKSCSTPGCGLWPATKEFWFKNRARPDGWGNYCKPCHLEQRDRRPKEPPEVLNARNRAYRARKKRKAIIAAKISATLKRRFSERRST